MHYDKRAFHFLYHLHTPLMFFSSLCQVIQLQVSFEYFYKKSWIKWEYLNIIYNGLERIFSLFIKGRLHWRYARRRLFRDATSFQHVKAADVPNCRTNCRRHVYAPCFMAARLDSWKQREDWWSDINVWRDAWDVKLSSNWMNTVDYSFIRLFLYTKQLFFRAYDYRN